MELHVQNVIKVTHYQKTQQNVQYLVHLNVQLVMRLIQLSVSLVTLERLSIPQHPHVNQQFQFVMQQNHVQHVPLLM